jgi:pimeloyl-ACP methyl ester carboxylesterase
MPHVTHDDLEIHYRSFGEPTGTPVVLVHGLMLSGRMFDRLALMLDDRWVITVDVRGHGGSSRPEEAWRYSWTSLASDIVAVLDHLEVDQAVVGGLSLGANVALAFGLEHPDRTAGLLVEMPVLERSELAARTVFGLLAVFLRVANPVLAPLGRGAARIPWPGSPPELRAVGDVMAMQPVPAACLMEGLLASPVPGKGSIDEGLQSITAPTLVIGHHLDPIHALDDAKVVAEAVPGAELIEVTTIAELRLRPGKFVREFRRWLAAHHL